MKLVVGLGNPGKEYEYTRHNVGFYFLDQYLTQNDIHNKTKTKRSEYYEIHYKGEKVIFLKPLSYMNLSGEVIHDFVEYFKIPVENILIIHDDMDLTLGSIRLRYKGSSGGHNGLKNISHHLKTDQFKRLKIGISRDREMDTKDYVLGTWTKKEEAVFLQLVPTINEIIHQFLNDVPFEQLMTHYNMIHGDQNG